MAEMSNLEKVDTVFNHMDEVRSRLLRSVIVFVVMFFVGIMLMDYIWPFLTANIDETLLVLSPTSKIFVYAKIAAIFSLAFTIPFLVYQVWAFVSPALPKSAKKAAFKYIPGAFLFFVGGLAFSYFLIFPTVFQFLMNLGGTDMEMALTAEAYFTFLFRMTIPFGVLFEMPVVMMFLTQIGIVNPYVLARVRKYAYFVLVIIGVCFSPPEIILDIITIVPMLVLFEISVFFSKFVYKSRMRRIAREEAVEAAKESQVS